MRIAITGHTSGIGKALYKRCEEQSFPRHEPIGFSRSNGFNINSIINPTDIEDKRIDIIFIFLLP